MPIALRLSGVAGPLGEEVIKLTGDVLGAQVVAQLRGVGKRYGKVEACEASTPDPCGEPVALLGPTGQHDHRSQHPAEPTPLRRRVGHAAAPVPDPGTREA